jgi:hypothetical protein
VTAICRRPPDTTHSKLDVVGHDDFGDLRPATAHLDRVDACFFCVGVPSAGPRLMWARAEDALPAYPCHTFVFRPGYIRPMYGARPRERAARVVHAATSWLYPVLKRLMPERTTSTGDIGRAMLVVSGMDGAGKRTLTSGDVDSLAAG